MSVITSLLSFLLLRVRSSSLFCFSIAGHGFKPIIIPVGSSLDTLQQSQIILEMQCLELDIQTRP